MSKILLPGQYAAPPPQEANTEIPEARRKRMLWLIDGIPILAILMEHLNRHDRCDQILQWCSERNLRGVRLLEIFQDFGSSPLLFAKRVVARIENESELRPVIAGRDWR